MDHSKDAMKETFFVSNILPQQSKFNQSSGAWFKTEQISECYRDITKLSIWGGVIWGNDTSNDFFISTHGIKTPDYWWKVIYRHDTKIYVAWLFPNHHSAIVSDLEDSSSANVTPAASWLVSKSGHNLKCEGHSTAEG